MSSRVKLTIYFVLLGILYIFGMWNSILSEGTNSPRLLKIQQDFIVFASAMEDYKSRFSDYPTLKQGLMMLVTKGFIKTPTKHKNLIDDPWGNPYVYTRSCTYGPYGIISYGADGVVGGNGLDQDLIGPWPWSCGK